MTAVVVSGRERGRAPRKAAAARGRREPLPACGPRRLAGQTGARPCRDGTPGFDAAGAPSSAMARAPAVRAQLPRLPPRRRRRHRSDRPTEGTDPVGSAAQTVGRADEDLPLRRLCGGRRVFRVIAGPGAAVGAARTNRDRARTAPGRGPPVGSLPAVRGRALWRPPGRPPGHQGRKTYCGGERPGLPAAKAVPL